MKKLSFLFLLIAAIGFQQLSAQPMSIDKLDAANKELAKLEYYTALEWYLEAYEDGEDNIQDNVDVIHNIAMLYSELRNYRKSASWYKKLIRADENGKYPNANYHLGYASKIDKKYDKALEAFDAFIGSTADANMKKMAEIQKAGIMLVQTLPEADPEISVENRTTRAFSSAYTEWSPFYVNEGEMYYTSLKSDKVVLRKGDHFKRMYKSTKSGSDWSEGQLVSDVINKKGTHVGNVTMSDDRNYMYYTLTTRKGDVLATSKIFVSKKEGGKWGEAQEVSGINDDAYMSKQPAFGKVNGNDALFFVSNMPGGQGGWDIYVSILESATAAEPAISLGTDVNTMGDDETPFYKDDQLYFASTGHPAIGGYDIFVADQNGVKWDNVDNLGKSINTEADELYFVLDQEGYHGFLVSNRRGAKSLTKGETFDKEDSWRTAGDDIFQVEFPKPVIASLDVSVLDKNKRPIKGVTIELREVGVAKGQMKTNPRGNKFEFPLDLEKEYEIIATRECYNGEKETITTKAVMNSKTFVTEFVLGEVAPTIERNERTKTTTTTTGQPIVMRGLNFDLGSSKIRLDAEPVLTKVLKLMNKYPTMVIELASHTDAQGSKPSNQALSQRRAVSSKAWLVKRGIIEDRIVAVGKGETVLLNSCQDGVKCPDSEHEVNRRTDFKIMSGPTEITTDISNDEIIVSYDTIPCAGLSDATGFIDINSLNTTELVFEKEAHDFGKVKKGETVEHTFKFTNIGKEELIVEFASGSCGCTVPEYSKNAIAPGATGEIKVVYTAKEDKEIGLEDQQEVTIIANTDPPVSLVTITAKIVD
ncbi:MAG: peptidoglycan-associated lipoprotein [Saprospiraceae bacterium]|jgi:peptidoglycan-associated lipoprotein